MLVEVYYAPTSLLRTLYLVTNLIVTLTLWGYYGETEAQQIELCARSDLLLSRETGIWIQKVWLQVHALFHGLPLVWAPGPVKATNSVDKTILQIWLF